MPSSAGISRKASQNAMTSRPPSSQQKTSTTTLSKLPSRPVSAINKTPSIPPSRPQTSDVIELSVEETPKPIEEVIPEPVIPIEVSTVETQEQSWNKQHQIPTFQQLKKGLKRLRVSPRGMQVVFTSLDLQVINIDRTKHCIQLSWPASLKQYQSRATKLYGQRQRLDESIGL